VGGRTGRRLAEPGLWLHSVNIGEYGPAGRAGSVGQHRPTRVRKLLAHKQEIAKLAQRVETGGMTIVPLKIYFKNGKAKLLIGLAQGKTRGDKRAATAKREADRDIARAMSRRM
jgi:SsrA-binding protein